LGEIVDFLYRAKKITHIALRGEFLWDLKFENLETDFEEKL